MRKKYQPYDIDVNTLGFYIDRLLYAMIKKRNRDLKEVNSDLQHSEFIVLKVLNLEDGMSQSELADLMGKERSGLTRILGTLETKGYIKREPRNGSTNCVLLTEKGRKELPIIRQLSDKLTESAFKGFSQKRRLAMLKALNQIYDNLNQDN